VHVTPRTTLGPRGLAALALAYGALAVLQAVLLGAPIKDEVHFWLVARRFAMEGLGVARDYQALSTPLPFALWGALGSVELARALNLLLSFLLVAFVGRRAVHAAVGLVVFPYFVGASVLMYTDLLAAAFVLIGLVAYLRRRYVLSTVSFVLAIASRQYMIAFPAGLLLYELTVGERRSKAAVAQALAVTSLLIWIVLWGGFAPTLALERWDPGTTGFAIRPQHSLYFLACVGAWYVVPEAVLERRVHAAPRGVLLISALVLGTLFVAFPPVANVQGLPTMGYLDRAAHLFPDAIRLLLFYLLALAAVIRFWRPSLAVTLVASNALLMSKAHIAWDKYALPLLLVLWYLYGTEDAGAPSPAPEPAGTDTAV
jgi:hypothetical protein